MTCKPLGFVTVDSGQVVLVDPCYLLGIDEGRYSALCKAPDNAAFTASPPYGRGVKLAGMGDGVFPVEGEYDDSGRLSAVRIILDGGAS